MRLDKLTLRLQEAIQEAVNFASEYGHQSLQPEHLFYVLLKQEESIIASCFEKLGIQKSSIISAIEQDLKNKPSVTGSTTNVYFSNRTNKLLYTAYGQAQGLKDEFISIEHILLALFSDSESVAAQALKREGVDKEKILLVLSQIRGSYRITDETPEDKFNALEKYDQNITDLALKIKLDPVIGRDKGSQKEKELLLIEA